MKTTFDTQTIELNPSGENYIVVVADKKYLVEIVRVNGGQGRMDLRITDMESSVSIRESVTKSVYYNFAKRLTTIAIPAGRSTFPP